VILAAVIVGLVIFVLFPQTTPEPVPDPVAITGTGVRSPALGENDVPVQGVPGQAANVPQAASAPTPDPRIVNEQRLREAVFAPFRGVRGRFGIFVKDLSTGQTVALNDRFPFQSASLYKLPVMYEVFKLRDLDLVAFNEEMVIGPDDLSMDLGSLAWPIGTRITIGTALDRMVTLSDNSGAYMLAKKVGSPRVNDDMLSMGLTHTHIRGDDLQTSAFDMGRLLEFIARGQALSPETSAEMVHLMARQQVRNRIPVLMPAEATVANKTGNWEGAAHDVAIVYGPRSTFVIALLSDGITDLDDLYLAMATASRNVYDLVNEPAFGATAEPSLPRSVVANYITPVRLPAGSAASSTSQPRPTTSNAAAPAPPAAPVDKPRAAAPTTVAPAPAVSAPTTKPTSRPADKPTEKPQAPATSGGTPVVKPQAPSIFTMPTPTKTP